MRPFAAVCVLIIVAVPSYAQTPETEPFRPPTAMEVALATDTPSSGMAAIHVRNPGATDVGEVVARVRWYADSVVSQSAQEATVKVPAVRAGETVTMTLTVPPGAYAQRVVNIALVGTSSTFTTFVPPSRERGDKPSDPPLPSSGTGTPPSIRKRVPAVYPPVAQALKQRGDIRLNIRATTDGHVADVIILTPHVFLDEPAAMAVRQWEFNPPVLNGRTYELNTGVTISFTLTAQ